MVLLQPEVRAGWVLTMAFASSSRDGSWREVSPPPILHTSLLSIYPGEHLKNWRARYFILRDDGSFFGFRSKPEHDMQDPLNNFTVRDCQIMKAEKPKPNTFIIRGLQWTTVVERMFCVESTEERWDPTPLLSTTLSFCSLFREEWIAAIRSIAEQLQVLEETSMDNDEMMDDSRGMKRKKVLPSSLSSSSLSFSLPHSHSRRSRILIS